jgi:hypothetical protein
MSIENPQEARAAMTSIWADAKSEIPQDDTDKLLELTTATVIAEAASHFVEFIYARREHIPEAICAAAANVCDYATSMQFYGLGEANRGGKISIILRGGSTPDAPEPLAIFAPPAQPVAPIPG